MTEIKKTTRETIGKNIKRLRDNAGMKQHELASLLELASSGHVSLIENGERGLPNDKILKISEIFKIHPSVLFTDEPATMEYAHLMGLLSKIILSKNKPPSFEALKVLLKAVAEECREDKA